MQVEVDQSGRFEFTKQKTVFALSNEIAFSVLIPATVKRNCIRELRRRGVSGSNFYVKLFVIGLFFLLRNYSNKLKKIVIDVEYPGKENQIKEHLTNLLLRAGCPIEPEKIEFQQIGKKSSAHILAIATYRKEIKPNLIVREKDMLEQFSIKKDRGLLRAGKST